MFSPSFDVLHSSSMVYMNHTELMFQDILLYWTKKVPENHNIFSLLSQGWNTLPGACSDLDIPYLTDRVCSIHQDPSRQKVATIWAYLYSIHSNLKQLPCSNLVHILLWRKKRHPAWLGGLHNKAGMCIFIPITKNYSFWKTHCDLGCSTNIFDTD